MDEVRKDTGAPPDSVRGMGDPAREGSVSRRRRTTDRSVPRWRTEVERRDDRLRRYIEDEPEESQIPTLRVPPRR